MRCCLCWPVLCLTVPGRHCQVKPAVAHFALSGHGIYARELHRHVCTHGHMAPHCCHLRMPMPPAASWFCHSLAAPPRLELLPGACPAAPSPCPGAAASGWLLPLDPSLSTAGRRGLSAPGGCWRAGDLLRLRLRLRLLLRRLLGLRLRLLLRPASPVAHQAATKVHWSTFNRNTLQQHWCGMPASAWCGPVLCKLSIHHSSSHL
jgi:hypothetical protein